MKLTHLKLTCLLLAACAGLSLHGQYSAPFTVTSTGLNMSYDSSGIFVVQGGSGTLPSSDAGQWTSQLLWYPKNAALRVGWSGIAATDANMGWDSGSIGGGVASGQESFSIGGGTASGDSSFAVGAGATGSSLGSIAFNDAVASNWEALGQGYQCTASGPVSVAMGQWSNASGYASFALGQQALASGNYSTALSGSTATGQSCLAVAGGLASGDGSVAIGTETIASGNNTLAQGGWAQAQGEYSTALGYFNASVGFASASLNCSYSTGDYSLSAGYETNAESFSSCVIGQYNRTGLTSSSGATTWVATDPLFEVGNGVDSGHLSDALIVYKNGNVAAQGTITCAPGGDIPMYGGGS